MRGSLNDGRWKEWESGDEGVQQKKKTKEEEKEEKKEEQPHVADTDRHPL